jgi:recombinational DNA repair protein (RecF pathway)
MAHHVYTTDAFVVESTPSGEANKSYLLFTRELGMIRSTAQGVRLLKSKLRFSLQDFTQVSVSVVRGKDIWRITNAKAIRHLYNEFRHEEDIVICIAQTFALVKRLVPGEEKNEKLFIFIEKALDFLETYLKKAKNNSDNELREKISSFESILVLNILFELGYLAPISELEKFIEPDFTEELLYSMNAVRKIAYSEINKSLHETQL